MRRFAASIISVYAIVRIAQFNQWHWCAEDAYITFRAARNWLTYGAPTFNFHEPSWPASSPLWTVWMYLGLGFGANAEWWSRIGSLVCELLLIGAVGRMLGQRAMLSFAILMAAFECSLAISLSGIEMWAMVALFAWALLGSRVALALLVISRPEGIPLALIAGWRHWKVIAIGMAGWVLMALSTGMLMPAGVYAKVGTYGLHLFKGVRWLSLFWPRGGLEQQSLAVIGIAAILTYPWSRIHGKAVRFVVTGVGLLAAYFVSGAVYFFWYMALPMAAMMLLVSSVCARHKRGWALACLLAGLSWTTNYPAQRWDYQHRQLVRVAAQLPDQGTIIMDAIGYAGWVKPDARFVDVIGLSSPLSAAVRAQHKDGWLTRLIQSQNPEAVVTKLHEVTANEADAGSGNPFIEGRCFGCGVHGRANAESTFTIVWGLAGVQIGQDVILHKVKP